MALFLMLGSTLCLAAERPEVADLLFAADFETGLAEAFRPYDNWGQPTLAVADDSPLGLGKALRIDFDDTSTVQHFDKGFLVVLPEPLPWAQVDYLSARYHVSNTVSNIRIFCHCDQGGWWDYTDPHVVVGEPGVVTARREEFRLAWTDHPDRPAPGQDGRLVQVFFSVHNSRPVNSGERFSLYLDDVQIGTWLLPLPAVVRADAPVTHCWPVADAQGAGPLPPSVPIPLGDVLLYAFSRRDRVGFMAVAPTACEIAVNGAALEGRWQERAPHTLLFEATAPKEILGAGDFGPVTVVAGQVAWEGRFVYTRAVSLREQFGLALRTGAMGWASTGPSVAGEPHRVALRSIGLGLPPTLTGELRNSAGAVVPLVVEAQEATGGFTRSTWATPRDTDLPPGDYEARLRFVIGDDELVAATSVVVRELDREQLPTAEQATAAAAAVAERLRGGRLQHAARQPLTGAPRVVDRERVDPARWTRLRDPVTWEDLGGGFAGGAQCGIDPRSLDIYFGHYDFGTVIKPHLGYFLRDDWRENLRRVAERNLIVTSIWGYVPDTDWNGGFGHVEIPLEQHREILSILGRRFLGYEMGEQDGRYLGSYAPRWQPADRAEARGHFDAWHQSIIDLFHGYMVDLGSLNTAHDMARLGQRMVGLEASQGLPSDILEWAFLRGAAKQWGVLPWNCISIFNRWGYKSYTSTGDDHGPDKGPTVELLRRLWYATWLYGSAINMMEASYFQGPADEQGVQALSPIGQCHIDAMAIARTHDRGVLYTPVALLLDRDCGWVPPRHLYTGRRYLVWGNLPYGRGDHATDAFFRWIWPKYEDCSYYPDERGFLTATPYGDMFDVIESDVTLEGLRRYAAVVVLGEVEITADLAAALDTFVRNGGDLVVDAAAAHALGPELTGVAFEAGRHAAQRTVLAPSGEILEEEPYTFRPARSRSATVLAYSESGEGVIWLAGSGRGRVLTCAAPCYVSAETTDPQEGVDVPLRHKLLRGFQRVLGQYFHDLALVEVDEPRAQFLCNVYPDPARLTVSLFNNEHEPLTVHVRGRAGAFATAEAWVGEAKLTDGTLTVNLPPGDLAIVATTLAR